MASKSFALALCLLAAAASAKAEVLLTGTSTGFTGSGVFVGSQSILSVDDSGDPFVWGASLAWAQQFTLTESVAASRLWLRVNDNTVQGNVTPSTFDLLLTNSIGTGAGPANVLFSGGGQFGPGSHEVNLDLNSLPLTAGTYYLVMNSPTRVPLPQLDGSDCGGLPNPGESRQCYGTGGWGTDTNYVTTYGTPGQLFVSVRDVNEVSGIDEFDLSSGGNGSAQFQLFGDVASPAPVPEPGTVTLFATGLGIAFASARLRRR